MNKVLKTWLLIYAGQGEFTSTFAIGQHSVVCADNTRKKTESQDPLTILVFHTLIVDQRDFFIEDRTEKLPVVGLHFAGVGKEKIFLSRDKTFNCGFFNAEQKIATTEILFQFHTCHLIFPVGITSYR